MKLASLACVLSLSVAVALADQPVQGSGVIVEQTRNLSEFDSIEFWHAGELTIEVGKNTPLKMKGDDNILPLITTEIRDRKLIIKASKSTNTKTHTTFSVGVKELKALDIRGTTDLKVLGVAADRFSVTVSGVANGVIAGKIKDLSLTMAGAGELDLHDLVAESGNITISGSASAEVNCSKELRVTISGAGNIAYHGQPTLTKTITGVGTIKQK